MATSMFDQSLINDYVEAGWWGTQTLAQVVARHAAARPDASAFIVTGSSGDMLVTWAQYEARSSALAATLVRSGFEPGARIGVILPDGATVHVAFLAAEKAGLVAVGVGARRSGGDPSPARPRRSGRRAHPSDPW